MIAAATVQWGLLQTNRAIIDRREKTCYAKIPAYSHSNRGALYAHATRDHR